MVRKVPKVCTVCGKDYIAQRHDSKYCSKGCFNTDKHTIDPVISFFSSFEKGTQEECWIWQKATMDGYGSFKAGGVRKYRKSHRFSYEYFKGKIPDGLCVLHKCHNRKCVNPSHLKLGTPYDNVQDDLARGAHISQTGSSNWKPIEYKGVKYPSIAHAADANGINRQTFYYQYKKGKLK